MQSEVRQRHSSLIQHPCSHVLGSQLAHLTCDPRALDGATIVSTMAGEISQMVRSARIDSKFKTTSYLVIGPAGSGKSTLVQHLIDKVRFNCALSHLLMPCSGLSFWLAAYPHSPRQLKALNERASQHALMHVTVTAVSGAGSARYARGRSLSSVLHAGPNVRPFWVHPRATK
jgi:hypothetical protein